VYVDGGIRRGTDIVKALCLGAKGVGLGRPFLYSLTYGQEGVTHAIESEFDLMPWERWELTLVVLRDEIQTTMRLLGVNRINQLGPHLVRRFLSFRQTHALTA
jgi:L-lactate dehydrogenase (cytochrome)